MLSSPLYVSLCISLRLYLSQCHLSELSLSLSQWSQSMLYLSRADLYLSLSLYLSISLCTFELFNQVFDNKTISGHDECLFVLRIRF